MKIIKEFWEFSKNLYNHNGYVKRSHEILTDLVDDYVPEEGKWFEDIHGNSVFIKSVENGKYYGHDDSGNEVEGDVSNLKEELTNELYMGSKFIISSKLDNKKLELLDAGSEGEVYTDGEFAYKIVRPDLVGEIEDLKKHIGNDCPSVVKILDVWEEETRDDWEYVVIKMELLDDLPIDKVDEEEFEWVREQLWQSQDNQEYVKNLIKHVKDPEIKRMLQAIIDAKDCVGYLDIGFHNLMYDSKNDQYKQIDIF